MYPYLRVVQINYFVVVVVVVNLHGIATNLDWLITLFAHAVIGRSNYFGFCLKTLN